MAAGESAMATSIFDGDRVALLLLAVGAGPIS
jgi:hypothetical protein